MTDFFRVGARGDFQNCLNACAIQANANLYCTNPASYSEPAILLNAAWHVPTNITSLIHVHLLRYQLNQLRHDTWPIGGPHNIPETLLSNKSISQNCMINLFTSQSLWRILWSCRYPDQYLRKVGKFKTSVLTKLQTIAWVDMSRVTLKHVLRSSYQKKDWWARQL